MPSKIVTTPAAIAGAGSSCGRSAALTTCAIRRRAESDSSYFGDQGVQGAATMAVAQLGSPNVEGDPVHRAEVLDPRHELEGRLRVDETPDHPGGGDPRMMPPHEVGNSEECQR